MSTEYTHDFSEVLAAERERIASQRRARGVDEQPVVGLAVSGLGVRASSFALGVLQAFDRDGLLRKVDYLSAVSGAGYIAAALSWFRRDGADHFPFGRRGIGIRGPSGGEADNILGFLRQHGDDLTPSGGSDSQDEGGPGSTFGASARTAVPPLAYAGVVARAVFLSTFVYGSILVAMFTALDALDRIVKLVEPVIAAVYPTPTWIRIVENMNFSLFAALSLLALLVVVWIAYPLGAYLMRRWRTKRPADDHETNRTYTVGLWAQRWTGRFIGAVLIFASVGTVPVVVQWIEFWVPDRSAILLGSAVAIAINAAFGVAIFRRTQRSQPSQSGGRVLRTILHVRNAVIAGSMLYGLLIFSHLIAVGILNSGAVAASLVILALGVVSGLLANLNQLSIGRMFRDRLMEAFLPSARAIAQNRWLPAFDANVATLTSMSAPDTVGPYPIINANLVTVGSRRTRYRNRGGDSFVLSPMYSGSDATGWRRTSDWMGGGLTLATAMSISGPTPRGNLGLERRGPWGSGLIAAAMFSLGLHVGFWAGNPRPAAGGRKDDAVPNYFDPGLARGVFGRGRHEGGRFVELTDGSEFDELGIYELIRRRADVVIAADATDTAGFTLGALARASNRARVDFGVEIDFADPELGLDGLAPGSEAGTDSGLAKRGFAVGTIRYTDSAGHFEKWGVLLYLKATMVPGLSPDVQGYKSVHEGFPHHAADESAAGEDRFEAYRELGYCIAKDLAEENSRRHTSSHAGDSNDSSLRDGPWL